MSKISVLMPVFNAERHLKDAIDSILNQTFSDFELLIFNDASTDKSASIISSFKDERIRFFNYPENSGYVKHLNEGISIARGEYIARMDADDISELTRFETQVHFLDRNLNVGICGTWYDTFGDESRTVKIAMNDDDLRIELLMYSVFGHPSVMIRKSVLSQFSLCYDPHFMPAEDYKLWVDLSRHCKLANIDEVLLHYRVHQNQISSYKRSLQLDRMQAIREDQIEYLFKRSLTHQERRYNAFLFGVPEQNYEPGFFNEVLSWAHAITVQNKKAGLYIPRKLLKAIAGRVKHLNETPAFRRTLMFRISLFTDGGAKFLTEGASRWSVAKLFIKCLLGRQAQLKLEAI